MARPKLTPRQKDALRSGALRRLRAGRPRGQVNNWIGRRFRVTRTAARFHFERLYKVPPVKGQANGTTQGRVIGDHPHSESSAWIRWPA